MSFEDKSIQCFDCGLTFTFGTEEQEFFHSQSHYYEPKRCPSCRQARKERQGNSSLRKSESAYRLSPRMFPVTCTQCGKSTQVPFEPREGRPVYCHDCYSMLRVSR